MGISGTKAGITLVPGIGQLTSDDGSIIFDPSSGEGSVVDLSVNGGTGGSAADMIAIAGFGDSVIRLNHVVNLPVAGNVWRYHGSINTTNFLCGQRLFFNNALNLGISGNTTAQMVARLSDLATTLSSYPNLRGVIINAGINDVITGVASATTIANLETIYNYIRQTLGLDVFDSTLWVTTGAYSLNAAQLVKLEEINDFKRTYFASHLRHYLIDGETLIDSTIHTIDGVHLNALGSFVYGQAMAELVTSAYGSAEWNNSPGLLQNTTLDGSGGTNSTTLTTVVGDIPTGWTLTSPSSAAATVTFSKNSDGSTRISFVSASGGDNQIFILRKQISGTYASTDLLQPMMDAKMVSSSNARQGFDVALIDDATTDVEYTAFQLDSLSTTLNFPDLTRGIAADDPHTPASGSTTMYLEIRATVNANGVTASSVFDVYAANIFNVSYATPGTYGTTTIIPSFDVDSQGRITRASNTTTLINETHGGTNQTSYALGDTLYASASNTLSKLTCPSDVLFRFLSNQGTGGYPQWSGTLPVANVGTVTARTVIGNGSNSLSSQALQIQSSSDGQVLRQASSTLAFGALDLSSANAVTGTLPIANVADGFVKVDGSKPLTGAWTVGGFQISNTDSTATNGIFRAVKTNANLNAAIFTGFEASLTATTLGANNLIGHFASTTLSASSGTQTGVNYAVNGVATVNLSGGTHLALNSAGRFSGVNTGSVSALVLAGATSSYTSSGSGGATFAVSFYSGTGTGGPVVSNGTIGTSYGLRIDKPVISGSGAITNNYGIWIEEHTGGGTLNVSIMNDGAGKSCFRAVGQSIYSSAASTLDLDATTTQNRRIGGTTVETLTANARTNTTGNVEKVTVKTSAGSYTALATDYIIIINKSSGAATTVNLLSSPETGRVYIIKDGKGDAATNNITVTPAAGNIDGAASYTINTNYASIGVVYNGTQWNVI